MISREAKIAVETAIDTAGAVKQIDALIAKLSAAERAEQRMRIMMAAQRPSVASSSGSASPSGRATPTAIAPPGSMRDSLFAKGKPSEVTPTRRDVLQGVMGMFQHKAAGGPVQQFAG